MDIKEFNKLFDKNEERKFVHNDCEVYNTSSDKVLKIPTWQFQRQVNDDYIQNLAEEIRKTSTILAPFIVVYVTNKNSIMLIDGQHRLEAIRKIIKTFDKSYSISVEMKLVRRETDQDVIDLYKKINTSLPFNPSDLPSPPIIELIEEMIKVYGSECIRAKRKSGCYMDSRVLQKKLLESKILDILDWKTLFKLIKRKNLEYRKDNKGKNDKADKKEFWLGFDDNYSWLYQIKHDNLIREV